MGAPPAPGIGSGGRERLDELVLRHRRAAGDPGLPGALLELGLAEVVEGAVAAAALAGTAAVRLDARTERGEQVRRLLALFARLESRAGSKKLRVAPGTKHGTVQRLRGEGAPILGKSGNGDLHYRFVIDMPATLTDEQKAAVEQLSKVMNGNPRERILRAAGAR